MLYSQNSSSSLSGKPERVSPDVLSVGSSGPVHAVNVVEGVSNSSKRGSCESTPTEITIESWERDIATHATDYQFNKQSTLRALLNLPRKDQKRALELIRKYLTKFWFTTKPVDADRVVFCKAFSPCAREQHLREINWKLWTETEFVLTTHFKKRALVEGRDMGRSFFRIKTDGGLHPTFGRPIGFVTVELPKPFPNRPSAFRSDVKLYICAHDQRLVMSPKQSKDRKGRLHLITTIPLNPRYAWGPSSVWMGERKLIKNYNDFLSVRKNPKLRTPTSDWWVKATERYEEAQADKALSKADRKDPPTKSGSKGGTKSGTKSGSKGGTKSGSKSGTKSGSKGGTKSGTKARGRNGFSKALN